LIFCYPLVHTPKKLHAIATFFLSYHCRFK